MPILKKILCPVDFSDIHEQLIDYALEFGRGLGAEIEFLYVAPDLAVHLPFGVENDDVMHIIADLTAGAEKKMRKLLTTVRREIEADGHVVYGYPAEAIVEMAVQQGSDLILMGTHGKTGIHRVLFGSVADQVIKSSPVPVITVRPKT
ncbi:MAG: universal stress protein [Proteobacteria bacterium]|nr:universal stress protein [Pseudomonadota bacterium]